MSYRPRPSYMPIVNTKYWDYSFFFCFFKYCNRGERLKNRYQFDLFGIFSHACCCWLIIGQIDIRNTFLFEPKAWCCVHHPVRVKQAMQLDQLLWYTCRDKCAGLRNIFCFFIFVNGRLRHLSIWVLLSISESYCFSFKVNWCIDLMTTFEYTIKVLSSSRWNLGVRFCTTWHNISLQ